MLGDGRIFYHLTYIDDLVEGFRLCGEVPAAAGRTYILAGGEVTTLNELVRLIADEAGVPPPQAASAGLAVLAGRAPPARRSARRSASSRRSIGAAWTSSRRAARSTSTAPAPSWATRRRSACERASGARWRGTRSGLDVDRRMAMRAPRSGVSGRQPEAPDGARDCVEGSRDSPRAGPAVSTWRRRRRAEVPAALVVGRSGWAALVRHELVTLLAQSVPGALGLLLRKTLYPPLLGACGRNVVFGQNVVLRHPHKIRIGDNVVIDDNCLLDAKGDRNGGITIGSSVFIGRNTHPVVQERRHRSRRRREHRIQLRSVLGEPRAHRRATRCWPRTATSSAATTISAIPRSRFSSRPRSSRGVAIGTGAWLGAGRQGPRRRHGR